MNTSREIADRYLSKPGPVTLHALCVELIIEFKILAEHRKLKPMSDKWYRLLEEQDQTWKKACAFINMQGVQPDAFRRFLQRVDIKVYNLWMAWEKFHGLIGSLHEAPQ